MTTLTYSAPIELPINSTTTVKAKAFHSDRWWTEGEGAEAEYITVPNVWLSYFDNTYWEPTGAGLGVWDGSKWVAEAGFGVHVYLQPIGGWEVDFRPSKIRVTTSIGEVWELSISDGAGYPVSESPYISEAEVDMNLTNDIVTFDVQTQETPFNVTNIEFLL